MKEIFLFQAGFTAVLICNGYSVKNDRIIAPHWIYPDPIWRKVGLWLLNCLAFAVIYGCSGTLYAQDIPENIPLEVKKLPLTTDHFYIAEVWDEREQGEMIAGLLLHGSSRPVAVDVEKGQAGLKAFFMESLPKNTGLVPVIVRIKKCRIEEKPGQGRAIAGVVNLDISFERAGENSSVHLVDYQGGMRYKRTAGKYHLISTVLARGLENSLRFLVDWMDREANSNIKLAKGVKVFFREYDVQESGDTVFYTKDRPIVWEDFKARPRPGKYAASIFTSFAWEGEAEMVEGYLHLHLTTKVFMLKNSSWVRDSERSTYGLNHERRHFDITKLVVERFKKKTREMALSPGDYDGAIGYQYIETYRDMNRMQDAYDEETQNGRNQVAQARWNQMIREELAALEAENAAYVEEH